MHNIKKWLKVLLKSYKVYSIIFLRVCLTIFCVLQMKQTFLSIKDRVFFEHKRSNDFYSTLKKAVLKKFLQVFQAKKLKDKKIIKILLKVIQKIYH